jgi:hypothetical protein
MWITKSKQVSVNLKVETHSGALGKTSLILLYDDQKDG